MTKPIRVLIADNDTDFSKHLQNFLTAQADIKVIGTVRDGQGAVTACKKELPDMVVMDLHLPVLDSVRAIQSIVTQNERIKILGVSAIMNDRYAIEAVKAGACGYLDKNGSATYNAVAQAIHQLASGEVIVNPTLASNILQEFFKLAD